MNEQELVEDPVIKIRSKFEWEGEVLLMDVWADPGAYTPEHFHPPLEERFTVIEGEFLFTADGEEKRAGPGEQVVVPAGVRHTFANPGTEVARFRCEIDPGLSMQRFFEESSALAKAGKYNQKGRPTGPGAALDLADFAERYRDVTVLTSPPPALQRIVMPPAAWLARRRGRPSPA